MVGHDLFYLLEILREPIRNSVVLGENVIEVVALEIGERVQDVDDAASTGVGFGLGHIGRFSSRSAPRRSAPRNYVRRRRAVVVPAILLASGRGLIGAS
jgi:hypothetical protein